MLRTAAKIVDVHLDARRERVTRASIDHIAILCETAAYGNETGVWVDGHESNPGMHPRIQEMAAQFQDGQSVWPRREFIWRRA
jgi:hypothetical protein